MSFYALSSDATLTNTLVYKWCKWASVFTGPWYGRSEKCFRFPLRTECPNCPWGSSSGLSTLSLGLIQWRARTVPGAHPVECPHCLWGSSNGVSTLSLGPIQWSVHTVLGLVQWRVHTVPGAHPMECPHCPWGSSNRVSTLSLGLI